MKVPHSRHHHIRSGCSTPALRTRRQRLLARACLPVAALALAAVTARAQTVGVQFSVPDAREGPALSDTQVAGVIPQSHFNLVTTGYGLSTGYQYGTYTSDPLRASDGSFTNITLTHTSHDGWVTSTATDTPNGNLLHFQDKTGNSVGDFATYTFNNLADVPYNLVAYIECDQAVNADLRVNGLTYYVTDQTPASAGTTPDFVLANNIDPSMRVIGNYVEFFGVVPTNGQITLTNTATGGLGNVTAAVNALQLQPVVVPEPSTWAAVLIGGAGLFLVTRHCQHAS